MKFDELWEPYSRHHCGINQFIRWCHKEGKKYGCCEEAVNTGIQYLFLELSRGRVFSTTGCSCGCGLDKAHSAICHYVIKKIKELDSQAMESLRQRLSSELEAKISEGAGNKSFWAKLWDPVR